MGLTRREPESLCFDAVSRQHWPGGDDSVHVLSKYKLAREQDKPPGEAIDYSISLAGSAITITTLWMSVGIALMGFSSTTIFQNLTSIITPIIIVALFLDLLFLPSLLTRFDRWIERDEARKVTQVI